MSLRIPPFAEIYEQLKSFFIANQSQVTDLNENQALDTQLIAFATLLNQAYVKTSGGFKKQFEDIPFKIFQFERRQATFTSSSVIFTRSGTVGTTNIPVGTLVSTAEGFIYITQDAGVINPGNTDSNVINVIAEESGSAYNAAIGDITIIQSSVEGVNSVTNNTAATGGSDKESNSNYFSRFAQYILGLSKCNVYGILTIANQTTGVQSASVAEHFPPESGIYNFTVYIDDGSGTAPTSLLDEVSLRVEGTGTDEYPGGAAAGINSRVLAAGLVPINIVIELDIDPNNGDQGIVQALATQACQNYINNLLVGVDVLPGQLIKRLLSIPNVYNVNSLTVNGVTTTVSIAANQVAKTGTISITFSASNPR